MSTPAAHTTHTVSQTLLDTSNFAALAGAMLLLGMSTAAFTKAGKGKKVGAKVGFSLAGLFLLSGTAMLVYIAIEVMRKQKEDKDS